MTMGAGQGQSHPPAGSRRAQTAAHPAGSHEPAPWSGGVGIPRTHVGPQPPCLASSPGLCWEPQTAAPSLSKQDIRRSGCPRGLLSLLRPASPTRAPASPGPFLSLEGLPLCHHLLPLPKEEPTEDDSNSNFNPNSSFTLVQPKPPTRLRVAPSNLFWNEIIHNNMQTNQAKLKVRTLPI